MNTTTSYPFAACAYIKQQCPDFKPKVGIVLGSGLGQFAEQLNNTHTFSYQQLPGFPTPSIQGHAGNLVLGYLGDVPVVCLQGRSHAYEGKGHEAVKNYVRTLKLLGCEYFIATNASGSMREIMRPGELMLVTDHINLQPGNPLVGDNDETFGPRFFPVDNAYDLKMRQSLLSIAQDNNIPLHQGVYIAVIGPNYETAAEIRAFSLLGADAVGMSTVPEVLVATHCGMKVAVIATMTNYATGLNKEEHSHESVVKMASQASLHLTTLLDAYVRTLA